MFLGHHHSHLTPEKKMLFSLSWNCVFTPTQCFLSLSFPMAMALTLYLILFPHINQLQAALSVGVGLGQLHHRPQSFNCVPVSRDKVNTEKDNPDAYPALFQPHVCWSQTQSKPSSGIQRLAALIMPHRIHLMPCSSPCPGAAFPSSVVFKKIINPHKCPLTAAQLMTPELFRAGENTEKRSNSVSYQLLIPLGVERFLLFSVISSCNAGRLSVFPHVVIGYWKSRQPLQQIKEL